ncbi:hypothetical protein ACFSQP_07215 [Bizionia sediminis]|uniref:Uncharacterized protein n=1 Tax=Bizionia sediminis TaxID=1737064 RepID=A0ABW5KT40_9FLAO
MSANLNAVNNYESLEKDDIVLDKDTCSITVTIFHNGEEVGTGTYTDDTGDCEVAEAYAYLIAWMMI